MNRFDLAKKYTQKYKAQLLPCKYCKSTDVRIVSERTVFNPKNVWSVCCTTPRCDCVTNYDRVVDAVAAWNRNADREDLEG